MEEGLLFTKGIHIYLRKREILMLFYKVQVRDLVRRR